MNQLQEHLNTKHGLEKMLNMLTKWMPLMKPQKLFNIYKLVLPLLNSKADLKKFNQN
jgi:hypothetical protein